MMSVPDAASIASIWWLQSVLGRKCGGSTGTNVFGALHLIAEMLARGETVTKPGRIGRDVPVGTPFRQTAFLDAGIVDATDETVAAAR